jgi:hypothetical protein
MCQSAITLISKALHDVNNAEMLLKIKGVLALFIQTMEVIPTETSLVILLTVSVSPGAILWVLLTCSC